MRVLALAVLAMTACASAPAIHPAKKFGAIAGLARDLNTGEPVGMAEVKLAAGAARFRATTNLGGLYDIDKLTPGTYSLRAVYAGQTIDISNIEVRGGEATYVDLPFTLGDPVPIRYDFNDPALGAIRHYSPRNIEPSSAMIEGTVTDWETKLRVAGAVVTAVRADREDVAEQTITDEHGRYKFENLMPGTYSVSAYYSIGARGQVEVQRNQIQVRATEAVIVPLWIELAR